MSVAALLAHMLSIAHGVVASMACGACFYFGGLTLVPRRWDDSLGRGESPAIVGAALYVILCWFGITFNVPLTLLAIGFAGGVLLLAAVRCRHLVTTLEAHAVLTRVTLGWLLAFVMLYVLAYLFTMPPATAEYLPPAWIGNIDLLTYVRYSKYLLRLGPSNLAGFSYLSDVYLQTPAVFYVLGGISLLFDQQPLGAAMPAQFALTALIGVFAARISRSVFAVSRSAALAIACILISGQFFRYVEGNYFLSTLMSTPILLYLLWTTVSYRSPRLLDVGLAIRFGSAYVLLLFMYPFLLFVGLAAQAAAIALMLVAEAQSDGRNGTAWREAGRNAGRTTCAALLSLGLLALCFSRRLAWSISMVRSLSQAGVAGWTLDIISPLAVLGLPGMAVDRGHIEISHPTSRVWAVAAFCAVALALGFLYFWQFRRRTTPAQRTLAGLAGGAFLLYCAYFAYLGPSYQQWKFASYSVLPLSFVAFAGGLQLLQQSGPFARATRTAVGHRVVTALLGMVAVGLVGGNLLIHAQSDSELVRFPGTLRNLAMVDTLPFFRDLAVQMDDSNPFGPYLALYFLPSKRVHVISSSFRPNEPLSFEHVSRQRPLLIQNYGCEGVGHDDTMTVPGVGCLLLEPPSLALATSYPFNQSFLFVHFEGLGPREPPGRWNNSQSPVTLELTADLRRAWVYQDTYINLLLNPYLPPGTPRRRLVFSWGADEHAEALLGAGGWISLPVRPADWTGDRLSKLPIAIAFPDSVAPHWVEAPEGRYKEVRPLAVTFEALSVSVSPAGRVLTPIVAAAR